VLADHVDHSPAAAAPRYTEALGWAREEGDLVLASYAVRHLGDHALEAGDAGGLDLLRRSYQLRAALGARPHTAAAAATLAAARPTGAEARQLGEAARITATELQLTWLLGSLRDRAPAGRPGPGTGVRKEMSACRGHRPGRVRARATAANRREPRPASASYWAAMPAGIRPRSLSWMPWACAQARMSRLRRRLAAVRTGRRPWPLARRA
jgi:hypothetical protein